jgi:hypothetical protein
MTKISSEELEARRKVLMRQLRRTGPVIEGSLAKVPRTCGNARCRCMQGGKKHEALILCKKVKGRSVATYIPKALHEQVRGWNQEHKKVKRILKEISEINEQLIRQYAGEKRRAKAVRDSLKVLGPER